MCQIIMACQWPSSKSSTRSSSLTNSEEGGVQLMKIYHHMSGSLNWWHSNQVCCSTAVTWWLCVCVCVCACARARQRENKKDIFYLSGLIILFDCFAGIVVITENILSIIKGCLIRICNIIIIAFISDVDIK